MEKGLVSIIIPSYNTERYIKEAVDSALAQTYKPVEIIVVDDGSTDNTKQILEPYLKQNSIIYIYQQNGGLAAARNTGIRASRGEYIALLDADDIFMPEKIAKQAAYLEANPQCDISYCDLWHFWDDEPEKLLKLNYTYYSGADVLPHLLEKSFIAPLSAVFRRSVFDRFGMFDEHFRRSEDLELWTRFAYGGANFCFLPEILGKLRMRRTANLQGIESQPQVKLTMLEVLKRLNEKMPPADREKYRMPEHMKKYRKNIGLAYLLAGRKSEAKKYITESMGGLAWFPFAVLPVGFIQWGMMKVYYGLRAARLGKVQK
ncbi:MAG TPA: glycosyltransferase family A protein [Candidatus Paceibacterota bacterium]|nr:glycosyltransferase family A protein [Candidatus Paceibacterota bacterium]